MKISPRGGAGVTRKVPWVIFFFAYNPPGQRYKNVLQHKVCTYVS